MKATATHFILQYSVQAVVWDRINGHMARTRMKRQYVTEPREMKHLSPLLKCSPEENVCIFYITPKSSK